jgi:eukaryotic-like serine/threonine-protein kinase
VPRSCPRCQRALPPDAKKLCVYCGAPLVRGATDPGFRPAKAQAGDPLVGTVIASRFSVQELIGQGGMGKVYRARHLALERTVVLKMLKPQLLDDQTLVGRFEREAKAASRLNHPNVIQVLDFGRIQDGTLYIVMEHVDGKDLRLVLRDEWPLAEERLCNIMAQVCSALGEAHANNVIHRDLKPENIMVEAKREQPDHVKVLDFGIAKILDAIEPATTMARGPDVPGLTRHDVVCGTPQYMAPEQATGTALDERCDLYALGVILYQMTTGHLPFDGPNSMEVLTRHVNEPPVPPRLRQPDAPISEAMQRFILRALEKDPARRPQTAEQFREELLVVPEQARAQARPVTPANLPPAPTRALARQSHGRQVVWAAGAALGALLLALTAWVLRNLN